MLSIIKSVLFDYLTNIIICIQSLQQMFFPDEDNQVSKPDPQKILYFYDNGAPQKKPVQLRLNKKKMSFKQISKQLNISNLRLFNSQGAQYFDDDIQFIKNKTALYASRGQQFDPSSCFGQYEMIEKLGQGGFGKVFLARHKQTNQKYAIKIIKTQKISSAADIDSIFTQVQVLKTLNHENIVKVHNCLTLKNMEVAIIMEYLGGGQLLKHVEECKVLAQQEAKNYAKQIVKGMLYCHQRNLIHRDLKLQNLLRVNTYEEKIKIIDFGIAGVMNFMTWQDMDTGSLAYMAPECFINSKNYKVDGRIDVWAVGVILYSMLFGQMPFKGASNGQVIEAIKAGKYKIPSAGQKQLSIQCIDFLKECLTVDSKKRPNMQDLCEHPWIAKKIMTEESLKQPKIVASKAVVLNVIQEQQVLPVKKIEKKKQTKTPIAKNNSSFNKSKPYLKK